MWHSFKDKLTNQRQSESKPQDVASDGEVPFELTRETVPADRTNRNAHLLDALTEVVDPELGVNIVELGLIYALEPREELIDVAVTATTPACPMSGAILRDVEHTLREAVDRNRAVEVYLVWEPAWAPEYMSDAAKARLGW